MLKIGSLNQRQTLSLLALIIGIILIAFASHGMNKAEHAKSSIDKFTGFFTNSTGIWDPVVHFFGGEAHAEASKYDTMLRVFMILGIGLVVTGVGGLFYYRKSP